MTTIVFNAKYGMLSMPYLDAYGLAPGAFINC